MPLCVSLSRRAVSHLRMLSFRFGTHAMPLAGTLLLKLLMGYWYGLVEGVIS